MAVLYAGGIAIGGGGATGTLPLFDIPEGTTTVAVYVMHREGSGNATVSGVAVNGASASFAARFNNATNSSFRIELWYLHGPPAANSIDVDAAFTEITNDIVLAAVALDGTDMSAIPLTDAASGNADIVSDSYTPTNGGAELLVGLVGFGDMAPFGSYGSGWTGLVDETTGTGNGGLADVCGILAHKTAADPAALETFLATATNGDPHSLIWMEVKAASSGENASATPMGVSGTSSVDSVEVKLDGTTIVTGVSGTGAVGSVVVDMAGGSTIRVSGIKLNGIVGPAMIFGWTQAVDASENWAGEGVANDTWTTAPAAAGGWS